MSRIGQRSITAGRRRPLFQQEETKEQLSAVLPTSASASVAVVSVGGSVIANAGDDLNTSALALEDGNIASIKEDQVEVRRFQEQMYLQNHQYNTVSMMSNERYSGNRGFEIR